VANGIEATFSDNNWFIENKCNDCQHGFWLGYSYNNYVAGNEIKNCAGAGIAWEHGSNSVIERNTFAHNPVAVDLWWDYDKDLMETPYGEKKNTNSEKNLIGMNGFSKDRIAIRLRETIDTRIESNFFIGCKETVQEDDKCRGTLKSDNFDWPEDTELEFTQIGLKKPSRKFTPPETAGSMDAFLPPGARRGREYILINEWGPYDFKKPMIWPSRVSGGREARFFVYGPGGRFRITGAPKDVTVSPVEGAIPGRFIVRADAPGYRTFEIGVQAFSEKESGRTNEIELKATGALLSTKWIVKYFHWNPDEDPREDAAAWEKLLQSEPVETITTDSLGFQWQGSAPSEKVRSDHFGTLATASLSLPGGVYELTTVSDDGIRLWVDGKLVIDNWTHHAPTEDRARVTLEKGGHEIRIEHFEIDGWAALTFSLSKE